MPDMFFKIYQSEIGLNHDVESGDFFLYHPTIEGFDNGKILVRWEKIRI